MNLMQYLLLLICLISFDVFSGDAFILEMDINVVGQTRHDIGLEGTTNLPTGTNIMVSLSDLYRGKKYQDKVVVRDGIFKAGPFGASSGLGDSKYYYEVAVPIVQPPQAVSILGKDNINMRGALVFESELGGKTAKKSLGFNIGSEESIETVLNSVIKKTVDFKQNINELLKNDGEVISAARRSNNINECVRAMHIAQKKADKLFVLSEEIFEQAIDLKVAAHYMKSCLTCTPSAVQACEEARKSLKNSKF